MDTVKSPAAGRTIVKELFVRTTPERAFRAFTEKSELEHWFVTRADVELTPGGTYNLTWGPGEYVPGKVIEIDPPHRFVFDWNDGPQYGFTRITVEFSADTEQDGTQIRLVHTGFGAGSDWDSLFNDVLSGWTAELEHLRAWLDTGQRKAWD